MDKIILVLAFWAHAALLHAAHPMVGSYTGEMSNGNGFDKVTTTFTEDHTQYISGYYSSAQ